MLDTRSPRRQTSKSRNFSGRGRSAWRARPRGSVRLQAVAATPETSAFDDILGANRRYAASFGLAGLDARAARGLAVLTCIDSRIEPLAMLGLAPGDAKILRNAGGRVTD